MQLCGSASMEKEGININRYQKVWPYTVMNRRIHGKRSTGNRKCPIKLTDQVNH